MKYGKVMFIMSCLLLVSCSQLSKTNKNRMPAGLWRTEVTNFSSTRNIIHNDINITNDITVNNDVVVKEKEIISGQDAVKLITPFLEDLSISKRQKDAILILSADARYRQQVETLQYMVTKLSIYDIEKLKASLMVQSEVSKNNIISFFQSNLWSSLRQSGEYKNINPQTFRRAIRHMANLEVSFDGFIFKLNQYTEKLSSNDKAKRVLFTSLSEGFDESVSFKEVFFKSLTDDYYAFSLQTSQSEISKLKPISLLEIIISKEDSNSTLDFIEGYILKKVDFQSIDDVTFFRSLLGRSSKERDFFIKQYESFTSKKSRIDIKLLSLCIENGLDQEETLAVFKNKSIDVASIQQLDLEFSQKSLDFVSELFRSYADAYYSNNAQELYDAFYSSHQNIHSFFHSMKKEVIRSYLLDLSVKESMTVNLENFLNDGPRNLLKDVYNIEQLITKGKLNPKKIFYDIIESQKLQVPEYKLSKMLELLGEDHASQYPDLVSKANENPKLFVQLFGNIKQLYNYKEEAIINSIEYFNKCIEEYGMDEDVAQNLHPLILKSLELEEDEEGVLKLLSSLKKVSPQEQINIARTLSQHIDTYEPSSLIESIEFYNFLNQVLGDDFKATEKEKLLSHIMIINLDNSIDKELLTKRLRSLDKNSSLDDLGRFLEDAKDLYEDQPKHFSNFMDLILKSEGLFEKVANSKQFRSALLIPSTLDIKDEELFIDVIKEITISFQDNKEKFTQRMTDILFPVFEDYLEDTQINRDFFSVLFKKHYEAIFFKIGDFDKITDIIKGMKALVSDNIVSEKMMNTYKEIITFEGSRHHNLEGISSDINSMSSPRRNYTLNFLNDFSADKTSLNKILYKIYSHKRVQQILNSNESQYNKFSKLRAAVADATGFDHNAAPTGYITSMLENYYNSKEESFDHRGVVKYKMSSKKVDQYKSKYNCIFALKDFVLRPIR